MPGAATPSPTPSATLLGTGVTDEQVGHWFDVLLGTPLTIVFIVVVAILGRFLLNRVTDRVAASVISGRAGLGRFENRLPSALVANSKASARREQRARTMASILKSVGTATIGVIAALMILDTLGIPTGPLLASAGIVGIAVGFGAQALVRDVISGAFMLVEDQYGVGDVVDLGDASGVVEAVGLRVTRIRDIDGTVWYIRNGQVVRVGNKSQGWARAVLDIGIAYGEDVVHAQNLLLDVANGMRQDEHFGPLILEEPEMWGVESVNADGVVLRLVVKTQPLEQWSVARELRRRIKERLDAEGVHIAYPQSAVWVAGESPPPPGSGVAGTARHRDELALAPSSSHPASSHPASSQPASSQPAAAQPAPSERAPAQPPPAQQPS